MERWQEDERKQEVIENLNYILKHPKAIRYDQPLNVRVQRHEEPDPFRNVFQVDKERIVLSKAFRRLKHKTQAIWAPRNDQIRTRLTHTIELSQTAYTIATLLGLNTDLTQAIAFAHDIGHPPFGHAGERALQMYINEHKIKPDFHHHVMGVTILQELEELVKGRDALKGLNLTKQVVEGVLNNDPDTAEIGSSPLLRPSSKARHTRLKCAFASCVHFVDHTPCAGSA